LVTFRIYFGDCDVLILSP
jgi:protocatechuate 3,4-dioxygenase beta subunit